MTAAEEFCLEQRKASLLRSKKRKYSGKSKKKKNRSKKTTEEANGNSTGSDSLRKQLPVGAFLNENMHEAEPVPIESDPIQEEQADLQSMFSDAACANVPDDEVDSPDSS